MCKVLIDLDRLSLSVADAQSLNVLLKPLDFRISQEDLWSLLDRAWERHGCSFPVKDKEKMNSFYNDPVWLLNGIFAEVDTVSKGHREAIVDYICSSGRKRVLDYGGGTGALACLLAKEDPDILIDIYDPYPTRYALEKVASIPNIRFVDRVEGSLYELVVCTDVLEHLESPLRAIWNISRALQNNGFFVSSNCFYPVIKCHLPSTFHLRISLKFFCRMFGMKWQQRQDSSHSEIFLKYRYPLLNLQVALLLERLSQVVFYLRSRLASRFRGC